MKFCVTCGYENKESLDFCTNCGEKLELPKKQRQDPKKKSKKIVIASVSVIMIGIIAFFAISSGGLFQEEFYWIYYKDNKLLLKNAVEDDPYVLSRRVIEKETLDKYKDESLDIYGSIQSKVSNDNKYIYFMDSIRLDEKSSQIMSDLMWKRLSGYRWKESESIRVDDEVLLEKPVYYSESGNKVLFLSGGRNTLMLYEQEHTEKIDRDVNDFFVCEQEEIIFYVKNDGSLYFVDLQDIKNTKKVADAVDQYEFDPAGKMYFVENNALYISDTGNRARKLDSTIDQLYLATKDGVFYSKLEEKIMTILDFVSDDFFENEPTKLDSKEKASRDQLKTELLNHTVPLMLRDLYFSNGTSTSLVQENVGAYSKYTNYEMNAISIGLEGPGLLEISNLSTLYDLLEVKNQVFTKVTYVRDILALGMNTVDVTLYLYDSIVVDNQSIYILEKDGFSDTGVLRHYELSKNGQVSKAKSGGSYTYMRPFNEKDGLMAFNENEFVIDLKDVIDKDVYPASVFNIKNSETLLYLKDYNHDNYNGTLCLYYNGESKEVSDDALFFFQYLDHEKLLYLEDYRVDQLEGDLMFFDGEKSVLVDEDVIFINPFQYHPDPIFYERIW